MLKRKIFGDHTPEQCNHKLNGEFIHHKPLKATEGKEKVLAMYTDGVKELFVPKRDPIDRPAILPKYEFDRLKKKAHVTTLEDKLKMIEESEQQKTKNVTESTKRKENLLRIQKPQRAPPGSKLESFESEAAKNNLYLLRRSQELIIEHDERVKQANGIILATKCRAIRNAQLAEKKLLEKQLVKEEQRLDAMMVQQMQKKVQIEEEKRRNEERKKQRYVQEIQQQIKENELDRLLEAEKIEEESRMLNRALIELQKEESAAMNEKKEKQLKMREEFKKANKEAEKYKCLRMEEQTIADLRIQEFMRQKGIREEEHQKKQAFIKASKEKEIARLRAQQEKSQDLKAALDEIQALRSQEEKEREWREQEHQAAVKKKNMIRDLHASRVKQIEDIRKTQAIAMARDEEDFKKVAKVQYQLLQRDLEKRTKEKQEIERHRRELLKQINEKERERIKWQQEKFEDGKAQRLALLVKDKNVDNYLKQKVEKLKSNNLPETYVKEIERQLKI